MTVNLRKSPYPAEQLGEDYDDGTMVESRRALEDAIVGHKIVKVEKAGDEGVEWPGADTYYRDLELILTLDNGKRVAMLSTSDCCAYTDINEVVVNLPLLDHMILGVGTTDDYDKWHIYCDLGDVLELGVGWSCGNPFYYGYGFSIEVKDAS